VGLVIPGLAVALLLVFLRGQTPANPLFTLRFVASRASLTRAARLHDGTLQGEPQWTPEVVFLTGGCGVIDQCGLAYRPGSRATGRRYSHVHGDWYLLYDRF
jgi:hypothetical protein